MNDLRQKTIDTYNHAAPQLAAYFAGIGSRVLDIDRAFALVDDPINPNVLEIGCGDGRDAEAIINRTQNYSGFDISKELIKIARNRMPTAHFEVADAVEYPFSERDVDVVFAFASLLHLNRSEVRTVMSGVSRVLRPGGILYVSTKYRPYYSQEVQEDQYGTRLFYFYNPDLMTDLAGDDFEALQIWREKRGKTDWFEVALRKI